MRLHKDVSGVFDNSCGGRSRSRIDRCHHPGGSSGSGSSSRSSSSIKMVKAGM